MSARGLYRAKMPESGAEYARVVYGIAFEPGEIPRPLYEAREYEPPFDALPTKEEHEVTRAKSDEVDSGEVVTISLSAEAYALIADRAPNPSEEDNLGGYRLSVRPALIDRLQQLRESHDESFSEVIARVAKR